MSEGNTMKITKKQLVQIIQEELERSVEVQEAETKLVNTVLDMQELLADVDVIKMLRQMADELEKENKQ